MDARGRRPPGDPDDWFDEPEPKPPPRRSRLTGPVDPEAPTREQTAIPTDDWLASEPLARTRRPVAIGNRRLLIAVGIAFALVLVGLAAAGVFSSGSGKKTNGPRTTQTAPATTAQTAPQTLALPTATLKPGDHGDAVKALQRALKSLGFTVGTIDGVFGTSTERALTAFQTAHHLSPDGVLGPATRSALLNALRPG